MITFSVSSYYLCGRQQKPFNPLLGETSQGSFVDGSRYYCEHTSHHPPRTHFLVEQPDNKWRLSGHYECFGNVGWNDLKSGFRGPNVVEFPDGGVIRFNTVDFKIGGTVAGERTIRAYGTVVFEDIQNGLKAFINMNTFQAAGWVYGKEKGSKDAIKGIIY